MRYFSSDNNSGVHPRIMAAIEAANKGNTGAYGSDQYTKEAEELFRKLFTPTTRAYFVFLGTAANVLGLKSVLEPHEGVICAESAHIHTDEGGAFEAMGRKLYTVAHEHGKITPADCAGQLRYSSGVHYVRPRVVSITQSTEYGTLYSVEELRALADFCHGNGLYLHVDGARIANAAAALGVELYDLGPGAGVDLMSFGGTKNGLMYGEAVLVFNQALAGNFEFLRKQGMQLGSKMRYISAQFCEYLKDGLWRKNAEQANAMTALLASEIRNLPGFALTRPVGVNSIFATLPQAALDRLSKEYRVIVWDKIQARSKTGKSEIRPEVRIMTSFDTTEAEVLDLAEAIRKALA